MKGIPISRRQRSTTHICAVALVTLLLVMAAMPALAMPRDPIEPDPLPIDEPDYPVPDNGFEWRMPARFGLYENGIVDFHWSEADAIYEPEHVNPSEFIVIFDGCRTWDEDETGTSLLTYTWTIDGAVTSGDACRIQHTFPAQGTYPATLRIIQDGNVLLDSQGRGDPFIQSIVVKDFLIVSIGDSYASGEGNPDRWQQLTGSDIFGQPTDATPAVWQDRRCHRSAFSAPAQAARMLEMADPHSSVTFLSFACSGATIDTHTYDDAPFYDPYRSAEDYGYVKDRGTGILGPGCGQEPPDRDRPQDNQLPSQISQTLTALTNNYTVPPRPVDALLISGGGNDMGFVPVIMLCALYWDCEDILVSSQYGGLKVLADRVTDDVNTLDDLYAALAAEIQEHIPFTPNGRVYITQYPDPTRDSSGGYCDQMLQDVIPWWVGTLSELGTIWDGAPFVPLPPYRMDHDEATWAGGTVGPALNNAVAAAAQAHGWILVDGINDSTANLFATHGYCAADNWIRTATEAVDIQGPWAHWIVPTWPANSTATTGTMHPTADGSQAIAQRIMAKMRPNLLPLPAGQEPAAPPTFSSSSDNAIVSTSGWLTGHEAGAACPGGAPACTFAQVVATSAAGTAISGASLLLNGAPVACSATGVTAGGLTCQAELTTPQTYHWSLAFATDGVYQLGFSASSNNGASATFSRQVKVDLTDPTVSHEVSTLPNASGWYRIPVTVTVTAADGLGSGPATIEYQLDGQTSLVGNGADIGVHANGLHALTYRTADNAGRTSAWHTLGLNIDRAAPVSVVSVSPAANSNGWYSGSSAEVTLSATDYGGSQLAGLTYSATGAQPIASTTVDDDDTVSLSITTEGETIISFSAADAAGNVEATHTVTVRIDRSAPAATCDAPDGLWHADNVSLLCTASDSGAGLADPADAAFVLETAVAAGSETAIAATGSRQVCDAVGNCTTIGPVAGNKVDRKAPQITLTAPAATATYLLNASIMAGYLCSDAGSGIDTCSGTALSGSAIDTASPGTKTFTVAAADGVGNAASHSVSYDVTYNLCIRFDQTKAYKQGSTIPIKLQLCDAADLNVSGAGLVVHAIRVRKLDSTASGELTDPGNANPDYDFRFDVDLGGYIFNLSTKPLTAGTWALDFTVSGDPLDYHTVQFDLR